MREFSFLETNRTLKLIYTLSDKTRLEILSLLIKNNEGLTAADISRLIDKKIPSTIYQLEIIQASRLITNEMKLVPSIGREIKHWILHPINYHLAIKLDLSAIILENQLSIEIRNLYLDKLLELKSYEKIELSDLKEFKLEILTELVLSNGSKLKDKDKTRIIQLKAPPLLIDGIIYKIRKILSDNLNINEGYPREFCVEMLGITEEVADIILNELENYYDIEFDFETQNLIRKA